jgi:polysaccharide pyruvyl transferase WcaK-like protein
MTDTATLPHQDASRADWNEPATARERRKSTLRIALFGLFGSGNFGNDGSLEAMLVALRKDLPSADLICICNGPDRIAKTFGIKAIPMAPTLPFAATSRLAKLLYLLPAKLLNIFRAATQLRNIDAIVAPGTGLLDDFSTGPLGIPLDLFCWSLAAWIMRKPMLLVSIGAGPIDHPISRWLMRPSARMAQYRSYRDSISKAFLASIGVRTSDDPVFPDLAFGLTNLASPNEKTPSKKAVGIGIMTYRGWRGRGANGQRIYAKYLDELAEFTNWLREQGYQIRLLSGDIHDSETIDRFRAILKSKTAISSDADAIASEPVTTLQDVTREFQQTDFAVATRYHNVVCALMAGKPTISVGYAEKNRALLNSAGLGRYACSIENFTARWLIDRFNELSEERATAEQRIKDMNANFTRQLAEQQAMLSAKLANLAKVEKHVSLG